jgi:NADPH-dependent glutamate synthase beta subunit-like oxidoreductase
VGSRLHRRRVEETGRTTKKGVFAGGDIVTGAATVINAAAGRDAGMAIDKFLFCCLPPRSAAPCA